MALESSFSCQLDLSIAIRVYDYCRCRIALLKLLMQYSILSSFMFECLWSTLKIQFMRNNSILRYNTSVVNTLKAIEVHLSLLNKCPPHTELVNINVLQLTAIIIQMIERQSQLMLCLFKKISVLQKYNQTISPECMHASVKKNCIILKSQVSQKMA